MEAIVHKLRLLIPDVTLQAGDTFYWSPRNRHITYKHSDEELHIWALLHEVSHAILNHSTYNSDLELLRLEVDAWQQAKDLAKRQGLAIDENHIQDCLDTYRDWLHQRSTCPSCSCVSLQASANKYNCHNCHTVWQVSTSRFCRPYRLRNKPASKSSENKKTPSTFY
jgi:hypothetical protein